MVQSRMANPVRMCIVCRGRFAQARLSRYQVGNDGIIAFTGNGRSFYICPACIASPQLEKKLAYVGKFSKERAGCEAARLRDQHTIVSP